ncbi:FkbM family methyltransferase [Haliangium sp.]|uniref:FkbM family methyltransferase n=1 Tax=Haliangium sp. TaxID=2663208 RepID=UPI003D12C994
MEHQVHAELRERGRTISFYLPDHERDHVQGLIARGRSFYENDMLQHAATLLKPNDLVIDVGAYIGNHTLFFAGICDAEVVAFEPNPPSFAILDQNIALNGLQDRVTAYNKGLGRACAKAEVISPSRKNQGSAQLTLSDDGQVDVVALDDIPLARAPRIIKIDVEGMEAEVLAGAAKLIQDAHPLLYIETQSKAKLANIFPTLRSWGYSIVGQFNPTPTLMFAPEGELLSIINEQVAYSHLEAHEERARLSGRILDLSHQEAQRFTTVEALQKRVDEVAQLEISNKRHIAHIEEMLLRLEDSLSGTSEMVATTHAVLVENRLHLRRIAAELFSLKRRISAGVAKSQPSGHAPAPARRPKAESKLGRFGRKYRKLRSDPQRFFSDSKSPFVRDLLGNAYRRASLKRRG